MLIRHATNEDIDELARIEAESYLATEAASKESIADRVKHFPECFWILEDQGKMRGFINGMATDERDLVDEMFHDASKHQKDGAWQMLFSVVTSPEDRGKGYADALMNKVIEDSKKNRKGIVLTCKDKYLNYYLRFPYVNEGISISNHGGVKWYQLRMEF